MVCFEDPTDRNKKAFHGVEGFVISPALGRLGRAKPKSRYDSTSGPLALSSSWPKLAAIETSQSGHDNNNVSLSKSEFNADSSDAIAVF